MVGVVGCGGGSDVVVTAPEAVTTIESMAPTSVPTFTTGDLEGPDVREIVVSGEPLTVAWADNIGERSQGLRGVADLGDLDGMLFDMATESTSTFTMRGVPIPLDIYFFGSEGESLGMLEMEPCSDDSCPSYSLGVPFRYALEVPVGSLQVGERPRLVLP